MSAKYRDFPYKFWEYVTVKGYTSLTHNVLLWASCVYVVYVMYMLII